MRGLRQGSVVLISIGLLVSLTGCPGFIANVVGASESIQRAIQNAQPGDVIRFMGTHEEDVVIDKDGLTLSGDGSGATIKGHVTVEANQVTTRNFTVDGNMTVDGNQGTTENVTITGVLDTPPGSFDEHLFASFNVAGWGSGASTDPRSFDEHLGDSVASPRNGAERRVQAQATVTLNGTFSCDTIVQPDETIQSAIDATSDEAQRRPICVAPGERSAMAGLAEAALVIDKSVNLQALVPGASVLTITIPQVGVEAPQVVQVAHNDVRMAGLAISTQDSSRGSGIHVDVPVIGFAVSAASDGASIELTNLTITESGTGISMPPSTSDVLVKNSTLSENGTAIGLDGHDNRIVGNTIAANDIGVFYFDGPNTLEQNNIVDNDIGINVGDSTAPVLDAEENWFGDASGPSDPASGGESQALNGDPNACTDNPAQAYNAVGQGDTIDDAIGPVDYCPWTTSSF